MHLKHCLNLMHILQIYKPSCALIYSETKARMREEGGLRDGQRDLGRGAGPCCGVPLRGWRGWDGKALLLFYLPRQSHM